MFRFMSVLLVFCCSFNAFSNLYLARQALEADDFEEAKNQLIQVAQIGSEEAQYTLGLLNYQGKLGRVDKVTSYAWFYLASNNSYPNASEYANRVFNELGEQQQQYAKNKALDFSKRYAIENLVSTIYPILKMDKIPEQTLSETAHELSREELRSDDLEYIDKAARAKNARVEQTQALISRLNKGYRHNAFDNLDKIQVEDESGLVIVKHDVDEKGKAVDPEVIFSWPAGRFDDVTIKYVRKSTFSPAKVGGKKVRQNGLISARRIGMIGQNSFRTNYPEKYRAFIRIKKEALRDNEPVAKYELANMLRAYIDIIALEQPVTYQELLKDLASQGFSTAQLDYAEYLIYQENNIDLGLGWLVKAVKNGNVDAEYRLADLLLNPPSEYLVKDLEKARYWFNRAGQKGHQKATERAELLN